MEPSLGREIYPSDAGLAPAEAAWQPGQLQALLNVALSSPDAEAGASDLLRLLASYTNACASAILLPQGEAQRLTTRVVYAPSHPELKIDAACALGVRVLREQRICALSLPEDAPSKDVPIPCQGCFRSCAAAPLRLGGSVVAVAMVSRVDSRPFSEQELLSLDRMSDVTALALLRLLWQSSQDRASQLADALRGKGEESASVCQELRRCLTSVAGSINVLLDIGDRLPWEQRVANMANIRGEALDLAEQLSSLSKLSMMEAGYGAMRREPVDLERILRECIEEARSVAPNHTLALSIPQPLPSVLGERRWLKRGVMSLLQSILRSWPAGALISVDAEAEAARVVVAVRIDGSDVSSNGTSRAGSQFLTLRPTEEDSEETPGLGRTICQRVIALCGGRAWAKRDSRGRAAFFFELPIAAPAG